MSKNASEYDVNKTVSTDWGVEVLLRFLLEF